METTGVYRPREVETSGGKAIVGIAIVHETNERVIAMNKDRCRYKEEDNNNKFRDRGQENQLVCLMFQCGGELECLEFINCILVLNQIKDHRSKHRDYSIQSFVRKEMSYSDVVKKVRAQKIGAPKLIE
ncbi:hypothetical protein ACLOJK_019397 [Asimina triloba]